MIAISKPETKAKTIGVALTQTDYNAIKAIAEQNGVSISLYVRELIRKMILKKKR